MAEPELEIEKRLARMELAIQTLADWSGTNNSKAIGYILRGEHPPEEEPSTNASP